MAQVPVEITPTTEPLATPPNDYQQIQSSSADFGGLVGQAAEKAGQDLSQASNNIFGAAIDRQQLVNKVAADNAVNNIQKGYNDFQQKYLSLQGQDATNAWPDVSNALEKIRKDAMSGLQNDYQRLIVDNDSRRLQNFTMDRLGSHYDQQQKNNVLAVNQATEQNQLDTASANWNNDDQINFTRDKMRTAAVQAAQVQHGQNMNAEIAKQAIARVDSELTRTRILIAADHDPDYAMKLFQRDGGMLTHQDFLTVDQHLNGIGSDAIAADSVNRAMGLPTTGAAPGIADAIHQQESGGRATSATSTAGAQGGWQIMPATFAQYARRGESISNPQDNETVGRRIINDLSQKFAGDPARVAVGYFSGPGNVAPPGSPTPWIADKKDTDGTSTSNYVQSVLNKMRAGTYTAPPPIPVPGATPQNTAPTLPDYTTASAQVIAEAAGNPAQERKNLALLNLRYATQAKAFKEQYEKASDALVTQMLDDPTKINVSQDIGHNSAFNAQQKIELANLHAKWTAEYAAKSGNNGLNPDIYGQHITDYAKGLFSNDPNDPYRLTGTDSIMKAVTNGGINEKGGQLLMSWWRERDETKSRTNNQIASSMMNYAERQMLYPNGEKNGLGEDPDGKTAYQTKFLPAFLQQYDDVKKTNDPEKISKFLSKDNIDKLWQQFWTPEDQDKARLQDNKPDLPNAPLPPVPSGFNSNGWESLMRQDIYTDKGVPYSHAARAVAFQRLMSDPKKYGPSFNKFFANSALNADNVVKMLQQPNAAPIAEPGSLENLGSQ